MERSTSVVLALADEDEAMGGRIDSRAIVAVLADVSPAEPNLIPIRFGPELSQTAIAARPGGSVK